MKCRVCHCTYERACDNGCGWAPGEGDLCTNCAQIVEAIRDYRELAYWFSWARLRKELERRVGPLPTAKQIAAHKIRRASPPVSRGGKRKAASR